MTNNMKAHLHEVAHPKLLDKTWVYRKYHAEGFSIQKLAKMLNCSETAIKSALRRFNIKARSRNHQRLQDADFTPESIPPLSLQLHEITWLAAVIDCEGWIGLFRRRTKYGFCYWAGIGVGNTRLELLEHLRTITAFGVIYSHKRSNPNAKAIWTWTVRKQRDVKCLLVTIRPHLLLKQTQADLILQLPPRQAKTPHLRANIKTKMASLNRRGR